MRYTGIRTPHPACTALCPAFFPTKRNAKEPQLDMYDTQETERDAKIPTHGWQYKCVPGLYASRKTVQKNQPSAQKVLFLMTFFVGVRKIIPLLQRKKTRVSREDDGTSSKRSLVYAFSMKKLMLGGGGARATD